MKYFFLIFFFLFFITKSETLDQKCIKYNRNSNGWLELELEPCNTEQYILKLIESNDDDDDQQLVKKHKSESELLRKTLYTKNENTISSNYDNDLKPTFYWSNSNYKHDDNVRTHYIERRIIKLNKLIEDNKLDTELVRKYKLERKLLRKELSIQFNKKYKLVD